MTTCSRCQRIDERPFHELTQVEPYWEGAESEAVCPNCQLVLWHPHCMSPVDADGERVDLAAIPRDEWDENSIFYCEYIDLTRGYAEDEEWPQSWTCPRCGGTDFEFVHADYPPSGFRPGSFELAMEEPSA